VFVIKYDLKGKDAFAAAIPGMLLLPRNKVKGALNKWRLSLSNQIVSSLSNKTLRKRTGDLFRSAADRSALTIVETGSDTFTVKFKNTLISYAYAHETGATITPKTSKFLAIPLKSVSGSARPKPLSSYKNTFIRKSRFGADGYTVYEKMASGRAVPIFILRKKAVLPKRPWFAEAVERAIPSLRKIIEKSGGLYLAE